jgi:hypothetical protein
LWFRLARLATSQRAGEHEAGLEGGPLRATRRAPGEGELVAAAKSLGLPQTLEVLRPSDGLCYVHGTLR